MLAKIVRTWVGGGEVGNPTPSRQRKLPVCGQ
jgi:hypothetical protein